MIGKFWWNISQKKAIQSERPNDFDNDRPFWTENTAEFS